MSVFSKILESLSKNITKELDKSASKEATKRASKNIHKQIHKEQRGIYNVTYNGKNATTIRKDLASFDSAIAYTQGNRFRGGKHIRLRHSTDSTQQGYITPDEVANLGTNIRAYINKHGDPHIDKNGSRIYEWNNDKGVKFRAVVNDIKEASRTDSLPASASEEIITFYSDRNLQKGKVFEFKNPVLNQSKKQDFSKDSTLESTTLINDKIPPMMRE